ncbi:MAG TPA: ABC transporter permease [Puia sp.]|nr:ABC transporter permease [Puia sp.]
MIRNYFRLAVKHFKKQQLFSLINVLGLTVGITCCMMIFLFVMNELSFDNFHKNGKNIYRVARQTTGGEKRDIPYLSPPYGPTLLNDFPSDIASMVRVEADNDLITYKNVSFNEQKILLTDSNFFSFFNFKLLRGTPDEVLADPLSIVMTESTAKKYFGNEDPIGKVIEFNKDLHLKVSGIAADVPVNSHLDFDMVVSLANWSKQPWMNQWPNNSLFAYVQLNPLVSPDRLEAKFPAFMEKYMGKYYRENGFHMKLVLNPLKDLYFAEGFSFESPTSRHGSKKTVFIFMSIAILMLLIACINFMNLSTARATDRSREVGLRKVLGALRKQLIFQIISESILFALIATGLSIILLQAIMPTYAQFLGYKLPPYMMDVRFYLFIIGIILVVGILAGIYPALLLSSFSPIEALRSKFKVGRSGAFFRKSLVTLQFGISVLLIASISIVIDQMHFVQHADLGFNKEESMIIRLDNNAIWQSKERFKSELTRDPSVSTVSLMSGEPGGFHDNQGFEFEKRPEDKVMLHTEFADFDYAKVLGLKIIAGRDFSNDFPADSNRSVIINRTAANFLGYTSEKAVGQWIRNLGNDSLRRTIVGVVEDFHYASLKEPIGPLVISPKKDDRRLALIKIKTTAVPQSIERIKKIYASYASAYPFEYSFLDESFDRLYKSEAKQETLLSGFAAIAIGIACLGLFGLASYTAVKRTKEIGVRKVLGSSVENIVVLLSKDLLKPVLAGTLIALPLSYLIMTKWLENFAYRISLDWWLFAVAALAGILVAMLTVSFQSVKAAMANPIKSLRTE